MCLLVHFTLRIDMDFYNELTTIITLSELIKVVFIFAIGVAGGYTLCGFLKK